MSIEETRQRWENEQKRQAEAKRTEQEQREFDRSHEARKRKERRRSEDNVTVYNAVVSAFGEEQATQIRWSSYAILPPLLNFGDLAEVGDLKLFAYLGSPALYNNEEIWVAIDEKPVTAEMIFAAEVELKKKVAEANKIKMEQEEERRIMEREIENTRQIAAIKKEAAAQEKSAQNNTFSNLWNRIKAAFQNLPA